MWRSPVGCELAAMDGAVRLLTELDVCAYLHEVVAETGPCGMKAAEGVRAVLPHCGPGGPYLKRLAIAALGCCQLLVACAAPRARQTQELLPTRAPTAPATAVPPTVAAVNYYTQGAARQRAGDTEAALRYLSWAIQTDPSLAAAYLSRSSVYLARGDPGEALRDAQIAFELEPSAQALVLQGESLRQMGQYRQASEALEEALARDPSLAWELFELRWSAARAADDLARIRDLSEEYAEARADDPLRHYYLAWAALESGVPKKAIGILVDGIGETARPPALLWYVLGLAYTEIEAWPQALASLETTRTLVEGGDTSLALHADPPIAPLFVALGEAYLGAGRCVDAASMLDFAISVGASASDYLPMLREAQLCQTPEPTASP